MIWRGNGKIARRMGSPNIASRHVWMAREIAILFYNDTIGTTVSCFSIFTNTKGYKGSVGVALT